MPKLNTTTSGIITATLTADSSPTLELQQNGVAIRTLGESQLVMGTAVTASGASVDFTSIPSWVRRITVMFNGISLSGTDSILVQVGSGSLSTSGYTSGASSGAAGVGTTTSTSGFVIRTTAATDTLYGSMVIQNITSNTWVANYTFHGAIFFIGGGVSPSLSGALDRVSVTRSGTNTFDAGTINIMWE